MLKELETLGKDLYGAKLIAQKCQVRNCPHFKNAVSGSECLLSMVEEGNPHHYFMATQVILLLKPESILIISIYSSYGAVYNQKKLGGSALLKCFDFLKCRLVS